MIKQKTGMTEKTIDTAFTQEESNLKRNKGQVETMLEDTQEFLEALRAIMICQTIIAFHSGDEAAVDKCRKLEDYFCSEYVLCNIVLICSLGFDLSASNHYAA